MHGVLHRYAPAPQKEIISVLTYIVASKDMEAHRGIPIQPLYNDVNSSQYLNNAYLKGLSILAEKSLC